jgi:membrane protease YdiL (CAAX protease family)
MGIRDLKQEPHWLPAEKTFWNYHLIEVLVFLFLIVPAMVLSFLAKTKLGRLDFISMTSAIIVRDLALVSLVFYFIWRNGETLRDLGWTWKNGWQDVFLGLAFFLPFTFVANVLKNFLRQAGFSGAGKSPAFLLAHGPGEIVLGVVLVIIVALAEETIFRGYLLLRFQGAHIPPLIAALLSSVIFSLGHGYEGAAGVITVGYMGLTFALIFLWRSSLVVPVILHFFQDFSGIVLPALLK